MRSLSHYAGMDLGTSAWCKVDQTMINLFAEATGDKQYIHTQPELAANSVFEGTIAHGLLTLSLIPQWLYPMLTPICPADCTLVNYGIDKLRFLHPVKSNSYIRCSIKLSGCDQRSAHEWLLKLHVEVQIHGVEKLALVAEVLTLMLTAPDKDENTIR
ncbi:putative enoyl-CoA hydratase 1 [Thalassocella blandensis]|nr:putative enoyl-CoA hydratase 1 [Thalassocella blandensis]